MSRTFTFTPSMDPHSLDVRWGKDNTFLGMIQWHKEEEPRFIQCVGETLSLTLDEMKVIIAKLEECWKGRAR